MGLVSTTQIRAEELPYIWRHIKAEQKSYIAYSNVVLQAIKQIMMDVPPCMRLQKLTTTKVQSSEPYLIMELVSIRPTIRAVLHYIMPHSTRTANLLSGPYSIVGLVSI